MSVSKNTGEGFVRKLHVKPEYRQKVAAGIEIRRPWYHKIDLGPGLSTRFSDDGFDSYDVAAERKWGYLSTQLPTDLTGHTVLDVGCCNGFFSIQALQRGAKAVVGIDNDPRYVEMTQFIINDALQVSQFSVIEDSIFTYVPEKPFDHVICYGVFYHILDPFYALFRLRSFIDKGILYFPAERSILMLRPIPAWPGTYIYLTSEGKENLSELAYTPHLGIANNWRHSVSNIHVKGVSCPDSSTRRIDNWHPQSSLHDINPLSDR